MTALARRLGKTPVQVTDRAGFVANALLLPYLNHAVRLLETGYATRDDIDLAVTAGIGLPMGPLALLDLIGLDTSLAVLEVLRARVRRHPLHARRRCCAGSTDAGRTGRKSGGGFYDYRRALQRPVTLPESHDADQPPPPGTVTLIDPVAAAAGAGRERRCPTPRDWRLGRTRTAPPNWPACSPPPASASPGTRRTPPTW